MEKWTVVGQVALHTGSWPFSAAHLERLSEPQPLPLSGGHELVSFQAPSNGDLLCGQEGLRSPPQARSAGGGACPASVEKCPFGAPWRQSSGDTHWGGNGSFGTSGLGRAFRTPGVRVPGVLAELGDSLSGLRKSQPLPSGSYSVGDCALGSLVEGIF